MKKITFVVSIDFEDKIYSDDDIQEIANNVANGLIRQANNEGLAPEESDTFTNAITISNGGVILVEKKTH